MWFAECPDRGMGISRKRRKLEKDRSHDSISAFQDRRLNEPRVGRVYGGSRVYLRDDENTAFSILTG